MRITVITEDKYNDLSENIEKILKYGGKVMQCLEQAKEESPQSSEEVEQLLQSDIGQRYGNRSDYRNRGDYGERDFYGNRSVYDRMREDDRLGERRYRTSSGRYSRY